MKIEEAILSCFDVFAEIISPEDLPTAYPIEMWGSNLNSALISLWCVSSSSAML